MAVGKWFVDRMNTERQNILIWLPSPMGDAVLCTPALRSVRKKFPDAKISFLAGDVVCDVLSPTDFCDEWIRIEDGVFKLASKLKKNSFQKAILFKNSFASALTVFLARITERIGYARDGRGIFLTQKLTPAKNPDGTFKAASMTEYYLDICRSLDCVITDRRMELSVDETCEEELSKKLGGLLASGGPLVILVPGGAFGPSKCWLAERFAATADELIEKCNASVVISVSPDDAEREIARNIRTLAKNKLYDLGDNPITLGELKALFAAADLIITNDTGPRHIAIALAKKVITLFGPNNPAWTDTGHPGEVKICGHAECVPCDKPVCDQPEHICMESISVEMVFEAAAKLLGKGQ